MAAILFRCLATLVLGFLVVVAAQDVQANDPTTEGLSNSTRQLFKAINENDLEAARTAVTQGANVGAENSLGVRPVDLAVDLGHFEVAHFLLAIHQAPAPKQEEIPLPPPVVPLPAFVPPGQISPPSVSGSQFSAPVFKPVPQPAIAPPVISPPVFSPPVISSPQVPAQPRITAPRIVPPAIRAPTLTVAPNPSVQAPKVPSFQAIPAQPGASQVPAPASVESTAIKALPEPPPLKNADGTLVRTPDPLPAPSPTTAVTATAKGVVSTPAVPAPSPGGFMSKIWDSMTGWVPFVGDKKEAKAPSSPIKQVQPSPSTQVTPAPFAKKSPAPVSKTVKEAPAKIAKDIPTKPAKESSATTANETPKKPKQGFFSSAWDSMTGWVPFTGDNKDSKNKASPKKPRLPFSSGQSSKLPAAQEVTALQSTSPDKPATNINDEVEARARAFAKFGKQKDAEQKARQEKAVAAAKQRAEAELAPPPEPKLEPKIDPVAEKEQAAAVFKQKVQRRRQLAARQKSRPSLETRASSESKLNLEPTRPSTPEPKQIAEGSYPKEPEKTSKEKTAEEIGPATPAPEPREAKQSVFTKIGGYFKRRWNQNLEDGPETVTAKVDPTVKDEPSWVQPPVKKSLENEPPIVETSAVEGSVKEFPETESSENSASYANLPLPAPPPPVQAISISKNVNLVVGTANKLGRELNVDLVEDKKCVEKTEQNILFCLERVVWPEPIRTILKSPLSLMGDDMAMIRYDGGKASQIHINFPTESFDQLLNYFEKKYGPPTAYPTIVMHRIGAPSKVNPTVRWRVANPTMGRDVILEIRKTDDLRSILPAEGAGVIRLYSSGDQMIFRYVSTADIMLMRMKYSTIRRKKRSKKVR